MATVRADTVDKTLKGLVRALTTLANELRTDHAAAITAAATVPVAVGALVMNDPGFVIGSSAPEKVKITNTTKYMIGGVFASKSTAEIAFTATDHDLADGEEAVYVCSLALNGDATLTMGTAAVGSGNATIPDAPAGEAVVGHVRIFTTGAVFNAVTDSLALGTITDTFVSCGFLPQMMTAVPTLTAPAVDTLA